jgi:hypothetical protein
MLVEHDDENFSQDLLRLTRTDDVGPHIAILWDSRILARLRACEDTWFTSTVLTLNQATQHWHTDSTGKRALSVCL